MFRNCCTYERVSTPPVPAFILDFYWLDLCIKLDATSFYFERVFDDESVSQLPADFLTSKYFLRLGEWDVFG